MKEEKIRELLEIQSERVTVSLPVPLAKRLLALGYKKYGTKARKGVLEKAGAWAIAAGVIAWEGTKNGPKKARSESAKV